MWWPGLEFPIFWNLVAIDGTLESCFLCRLEEGRGLWCPIAGFLGLAIFLGVFFAIIYLRTLLVLLQSTSPFFTSSSHPSYSHIHTALRTSSSSLLIPTTELLSSRLPLLPFYYRIPTYTHPGRACCNRMCGTHRFPRPQAPNTLIRLSSSISLLRLLQFGIAVGFHVETQKYCALAIDAEREWRGEWGVARMLLAVYLSSACAIICVVL